MNKRFSLLAALALIISLGSFGLFGTAQAQTASASCVNIPFSLGYGSTDPNVVTLQNFLNQKGYMSYASTGYFGSITEAAVVKFQTAYGVPGTGFVGPLTRAQMAALTCLTVAPGSVVLSSIAPSTAAVGSQVTITGSGFTGDNTVFFGGGAVQHVPLDPMENLDAMVCTTAPNCALPVEKITFTIPSAIGPYCAAAAPCPDFVRLVTSGVYPLYVTNANGTSNTLDLTVTGNNLIVP